MPLKIRCPHCGRTLLAEDDTAGQGKRCPSCGMGFTVPIPVHVPPQHVEVAGKCPRCKADMAPGTEHCPSCHFDLAAGKRLPLRRRMQFVSARTWTLGGLGAVATVALILVGAHVYLDRARPGTQPMPASAPAKRHDHEGARWAGSLLDAESAAQRSLACEELLRLGRPALPALAQALEKSGTAGSVNRWRNRVAAVEIFGRSGESRWLPLLEKLQKDDDLREPALQARALLGDNQVADELTSIWLARLRRQMFLGRAAELTSVGAGSAAGAVVRRTQRETGSCAEALRRLAEPPGATVIDDVLATYWDSWGWLGQRRGEVLAVELFELAKPPKRKDLEFKYRVRAARAALDRAAERGSPSACAAAAVVLAHCAPQYKSLRRRIVVTLASILPERAPLEQQRISWTLARLTGHSFDGLSEKDDPLDFSRQAVLDAVRWARSSGTAEPGPLRTASAAYGTPPRLTRRVVPPHRQLECDLLREFGSGWAAVGPALDRWLGAELGCTSRVDKLLDPGQRTPNPPALAAAMILAAQTGAGHLRPRLELWCQATDQPAWMRGFAYTVLGALDAQGEHPIRGWPANLDPEMINAIGSDEPDWDLWGRLLAAGGPRLRARLEQAPPGSLSPATTARLLRSAEQASRRRPHEP